MLIPKIQPYRNKKYLDWVALQPSVISGKPADEGHHIKGHGYGGSVKPSDVFTFPLTREEHTEFHNIGWCSWEDKYNVDQRDLVLQTIEKYAKEVGI